MKIYMAVTPDEYETVIAFADTPYALSRKLGGKPDAKHILDLIYKKANGKRLGMKFIVVDDEELG